MAMFPGAWSGYPWVSTGCSAAGCWGKVKIEQVEGFVPRVWYPGQAKLATLFGRGFYECSCQKSLEAVTFSGPFIHHSLCL